METGFGQENWQGWRSFESQRDGGLKNLLRMV